MRPRRATQLGAHPFDRPAGEVDAVEGERAAHRGVGGAAEAPSAFAAAHGQRAQTQRRGLQLAVAAQVGPAAFDPTTRRQRAGHGRRGACRALARRLQPRRETGELARIDAHLPRVLGRLGGELSLGVEAVACSQQLEARADVAVAVGVARLALQRHAGEEALGQNESGLAARRREQLERGPGARGRQVELELALHVQSIDAAREQRIGRARPPRRRIEFDERGLARGTPGRIGAGPAQPAGEGGAGRAEAGFGGAQQDLARAAARLEADPRGLRRAPGEAAISEAADQVGAQLDLRGLGRGPCGEASAEGLS